MTVRRRQAGFTLLELLVALAVFGFVLIALAQGTRFGLSAWTTDVRLASGNDDLNTVDALVRHVIEGMNPGDDLDPAPMTGGSDRLECLTELPYASSASPTRRMHAALLVDSAHQLILRWQPYVHAISLRPPLAATDTILLRHVARLQLAYWQPGGQWLASWHGADLPALIRARVEFTKGDPRHWPDIVASPRLDRP